MFTSEIRKAVVAGAAGLFTVWQVAIEDNVLQADDYWTVAIAIATAVGVYIVPNVANRKARRYSKAIVAAVGAGLTAAAGVYGGGFTPNELTAVAGAILGALGVLGTTNEDSYGENLINDYYK